MAEPKRKILIVDDERVYIDVLVDLLQDEYQVVIAKNGEQALRRAAEIPPPDLILLDWLMPGMDGLSACRKLNEIPETKDIPIIFLTVKSEVDDEIKGFACGAVDYIRKPMSPPIVKTRIRAHLELRQVRRELQIQNQQLEQRVLKRTEELEKTKDVAIYCMASLAETRDNETGNHLRRTQNYVRMLANHLRDHNRFRNVLNDPFINLLYKSAPLHDIGKIGVPDRILLKPGPLDEVEWEEMKRHTVYGREAIERAEHELGSTPFLGIAKDIAATHHEQWDGSGYPEGFHEEKIPAAGRLMALADMYDALISERVYKPAFSHEKTVEIIREKHGNHLDPVIVDSFLTLNKDFFSIAQQYR